MNSIGAAVIGNSVNRHSVDDGLVVDVMNVRDVYVVDRAVVVKVAATPLTTVITLPVYPKP